MKIVFAGLVLGLIAISLVACSKSEPQAAVVPTQTVNNEAPPSSLNVQRSEVKTTVGKVEAVDLKTRKLTLRTPQGRIFVIQVGKEAVNLPQVRKGDLIDITYGRDMEVRLAEPGEEFREQSKLVAGAKPGAKPRGVEIMGTNVTAKILALDKVNQLVELEFTDGPTAVVKVQNPANLDRVKVGDTIAISYLEVMEVAVRKDAKR